jgi:group I intron endonuclease
VNISGIYSIKHVTSGRTYIGSSAHVPRRLYIHKRMLRLGTHDNVYLQRAWNLYGEGAFVFIAEEIIKDPAQLLIREQAWIDAIKAGDPEHGFNLCPVAGSRAGSKQPDGFAERMRQVHAGKPKSAEQRARMSVAKLGVAKSAEHRQHTADGVRKRIAEDPAYAAAIAAGQFKPGQQIWNKGKANSPEARTKMAAAKKAYLASPEGQAKLNSGTHGRPFSPGQPSWNKGKPFSAETRARMSAAAKARWEAKLLTKSL